MADTKARIESSDILSFKEKSAIPEIEGSEKENTLIAPHLLVRRRYDSKVYLGFSGFILTTLVVCKSYKPPRKEELCLLHSSSFCLFCACVFYAFDFPLTHIRARGGARGLDKYILYI